MDDLGYPHFRKPPFFAADDTSVDRIGQWALANSNRRVQQYPPGDSGIIDVETWKSRSWGKELVLWASEGYPQLLHVEHMSTIVNVYVCTMHVPRYTRALQKANQDNQHKINNCWVRWCWHFRFRLVNVFLKLAQVRCDPTQTLLWMCCAASGQHGK